MTLPEDLDWLLVELDAAPHVPLAPKHALRNRRRASPVELLAQDRSSNGPIRARAQAKASKAYEAHGAKMPLDSFRAAG